MYSVTISRFPIAENFPIEILGCKTNGLFKTATQVSCTSYGYYREFKLKAKIDINVRATVRSANGSNLGLIGIAKGSLLLVAHEFEHKFIVCKYLLHPVVLGLDFAQDFRVGIDWNYQGHLYLHKDLKSLTYTKPSPSKYPTIFSVECDEARLISTTNILILPPTQ